jgi:hypothetical protein
MVPVMDEMTITGSVIQKLLLLKFMWAWWCSHLNDVAISAHCFNTTSCCGCHTLGRFGFLPLWDALPSSVPSPVLFTRLDSPLFWRDRVTTAGSAGFARENSEFDLRFVSVIYSLIEIF